MKTFFLKTFTTLISLLFVVSLFSNNIVSNGNFESGLNHWGNWFNTSSGYNAVFQTTNSEVYSGSASGQVTISSIGSDAAFHKIMVKNTSFTLQANVDYEVSFYLKSNTTQSFSVQIHKDSSPYTLYAEKIYTASGNWQQYSFNFTSPVTTSDVRFAFKLGNRATTYYFDNIEIAESSQEYNSVIDPNYSIDWSRSGVPGGIPEVPTTVNVLDYGAVGNGSTNNLAAFEAALAAADYGEAVIVPAGTYRINGSLRIPEGRVLRGECPSDTRLEFFVNSKSPCIDIVTFEYGSFQAVTSGFQKGSNAINVNNPSAFSVGDYLEIQQENDPVLMYTEDRWNESWAANAVGQLFKVTGKSGNRIDLDRPVFYGFNPSLDPEVRAVGLIEDVGIEDLYIERLDASDGSSILIKNAALCWVKNIESNMTFRSHVDIQRGIDCEVRGSYFHHSHDYGGGGHAYGVDLATHTTSVLVENNALNFLRHALLIQLGATGNVFGYNYSTAPYWSNSNTNIPPDISMHGHFPNMNLFEGNIVVEATFSDHWGPVGPGNTMFRNRVTTSDIWLRDHSHRQNIIANELTGNGANVLIDPTVNNTWSHSNNENGTIRTTATVPIPASLYLDSKPDFLTGYPFPAFGHDVTLGANRIPAQDRFEENGELCGDICPGFDDSLIGQPCNDGNPNTENDRYTSDCICVGTPVSANDCNLISNGDFSNGTRDWNKWGCDINSVAGACRITNVQQGANRWNAALAQGDFRVQQGRQYEVSFDAASIQNNKTIYVKVGLSESPWTSFLYQEISLTPNNKRFNIPFTMSQATSSKVRLEFHLATSTTGLIVDNVELVPLSNDCDDSNDCEQIQNPNFTGQFTDDWRFFNCQATAANNGINIDVPYVAQNPWNIAVKQRGLNYEQGKSYRVSFKARANASRTIGVKAGRASSPYTSYNFKNINLSTSLQTHTFTFTMNNNTDSDAYLEFFLGTSAVNLFLGEVSVVETGCAGLREDLSNGIIDNYSVFPNPASDMLTVQFDLADDYNSGIIRLFDVNGKMILEEQKAMFSSNQFQLNVQTIPAGVYMLRVDVGGYFLTHKVVKY